MALFISRNFADMKTINRYFLFFIVNDFCVTADAELLCIAIYNLISNAVKNSCCGNDRVVGGSRDKLVTIISDEVADGNASETAGSASSETAGSASSKTAISVSSETAISASSETAGSSSSETADSASSKFVGSASSKTAGSASSRFVGSDSVVVIIDCSCFIIEDQGISISESDFVPVFQPFYCASNVSGKGVGLALSKSILQRMGATIAVISSINSGTTFTITFPS